MGDLRPGIKAGPQKLARLLGGLLDLLCPPRCHLCGTFLPLENSGLKTGLSFCKACLDDLPAFPSSYCRKCGRPFFSGPDWVHTCGSCLEKPPFFDQAAAAGLFEGRLRTAIHYFKYNGLTELSHPLARYMAAQLNPPFYPPQADLILPVPLHVRRLSQRGFNQALLLAKALFQPWADRVAWNILLRPRWTEPQVSLTGQERKQNVRQAFSVSQTDRLDGRTVMIVDDVYTTGATVNECARVLKNAGAARVMVLTLARVHSS